jgi:hypothetical protein
MPLQPRRAPGRNDRKAATYASEIVRLRSAGYTFEAIREALADVGIEISEATLRRELRRPQPSAPRTAPTATPASAPSPVASAPLPPAPTGASGREIAEAFFNANPSNPLLRTNRVKEPS